MNKLEDVKLGDAFFHRDKVYYVTEILPKHQYSIRFNEAEQFDYSRWNGVTLDYFNRNKLNFNCGKIGLILLGIIDE